MTARFIAAAAIVLLTAGCDPISAEVGVGAVGMGAAQERGLEGAVDDAKIRTDIDGSWAKHDFDVFRKVSLNIMEGRVMLTGSVARPELREEAVRMTWQAAGVREVFDDIQVENESGTWDDTKDTWIAEKLRTKLMFDGDIRNINYDTDVVNGIVYILGIARDQAELDRVVAYARDVSGVKKVVNHVILRNSPERYRSE